MQFFAIILVSLGAGNGHSLGVIGPMSQELCQATLAQVAADPELSSPGSIAQCVSEKGLDDASKIVPKYECTFKYRTEVPHGGMLATFRCEK